MKKKIKLFKKMKMGHVVDPVRLMNNMERMGIKILV